MVAYLLLPKSYTKSDSDIISFTFVFSTTFPIAFYDHLKLGMQGFSTNLLYFKQRISLLVWFTVLTTFGLGTTTLFSRVVIFFLIFARSLLWFLILQLLLLLLLLSFALFCFTRLYLIENDSRRLNLTLTGLPEVLLQWNISFLHLLVCFTLTRQTKVDVAPKTTHLLLN